MKAVVEQVQNLLGFTDNSTEDTVSAGSSVTRITNSSAGATTETSTLSSFAYNGDGIL